MARIAGITTGRMVDMGAKDSMNMGAAMAPAAFHTIEQNLEDFQVNETWYDKIITGDPRYRTAHGSGFYLSPQVPCCPRSASMKDRAYRALPMQSSLNI